MYLLVKWMENDFLAMKKFCPWLKAHFPSISQANMYFFSIGKNFLSRQEIYFVLADGQGRNQCMLYSRNASLQKIRGYQGFLSQRYNDVRNTLGINGLQG